MMVGLWAWFAHSHTNTHTHTFSKVGETVLEKDSWLLSQIVTQRVCEGDSTISYLSARLPSSERGDGLLFSIKFLRL